MNDYAEHHSYDQDACDTRSTRLLTPPRTSTKQLTWIAAERKYVGEASSTNGFGRVYSDACDEGITLVGQDREVVFVVQSTKIGNDGDVESWTLVPAVLGERRRLNVSVILFND